MVMQFPVASPMVEFVKEFVDRDLAWVVGLTYWYTYAVSYAAVIAAAGDVVAYWSLNDSSKVLVFLLFPLLVLAANNYRAKVFGNIEIVGGILKIAIVLVLGIAMYVINSGAGLGHDIGTSYIKDGIQHRDEAAPSGGVAALIAISLAVYPYIGVEAVTVTALEARDPRQVKFAAKNIAWITLLLYMFNIIGFVLNVQWTNPYLPRYYDQWGGDNSEPVSLVGNEVQRRQSPTSPTLTHQMTKALPVIALEQTQKRHFADAINGFLLYSALSTANSALFVASRICHGLAQGLQDDADSIVIKWLASLSHVGADKIPRRAVFASWILSWVPLLSLGSSFTAKSVQQVLFSAGSTTCVLVWASQSLAFLRYYYALRDHSKELTGSRYSRYRRWERMGAAKETCSHLGHWQPGLAWLSLLASVAIVLGFAGAGLVSDQHLVLKALNIYLGPGTGLIIFIVLKCFRFARGEIGLAKINDWDSLRDTLDRLANSVRQRQPQSDDEGGEYEHELAHTIRHLGLSGGAPQYMTSMLGSTAHQSREEVVGVQSSDLMPPQTELHRAKDT
ncbi:hypothetical protein EV356DRAFT_503739 [Viridothelium virens]|uniref:Amino acid permease/ SLC12A domain-containing protein n=1 Tax=Viridothelium virens TaxID=1048519 RepID=A0A6A6H5W4_VIRVR|nr:hypothetical protein EV356DRAFT_503739 [Viridothelium virens]